MMLAEKHAGHGSANIFCKVCRKLIDNNIKNSNYVIETGHLPTASAGAAASAGTAAAPAHSAASAAAPAASAKGRTGAARPASGYRGT